MAIDDARAAGRVRSESAAMPPSAETLAFQAPLGLDEFLSESRDDAPAAEEVEIEPPPPPVIEQPRPVAAVAVPHVPEAPVHEHPVETKEAETRRVPAERTLADLIDRGDALDWREAVGIVHALCLQLMSLPRQEPVLLDPKNIRVDDDGAVKLLRAPAGGDALVTQLGRLLKTLVANTHVPSELRLLLSQTSFEVPILESVDEVARALAQVGGFGETPAVGSALLNGEPAGNDRWGEHVRPARPSILPERKQRGRTLLERAYGRANSSRQEALLVASVVIGLAVIGGLVLSRSGSSARLVPGTQVATAPPPGPSGDAAAILAPITETAVKGANRVERDSTPPRAPVPPARPPARLETPPVSGTAGSRGARPDAAALVPAPSVERAPRAAPAISPRESERRAAALIAEGQADQAALAFDALVMSNPLYEPTRHELTPEAFAAFQKSRRSLLPMIALRDYSRARSALDGGNVDRAIAEGNQAVAILDKIESNPPPNLREQVAQLLEQAAQARLAADEIVYSRASAGVVPPRPLSRQFPVTTPYGIPPNRVGVLEMVIGKQGDVEFVKLHAPLNRYHERMIVSAAKAWRYRPATRDGKPVRYRLNVTINLPESGTEQ